MGRRVKRSVQIYLYPHSEPERVLLDVWDQSKHSTGRPQEVFRAILRAGLKAMVEQGTLPYNIIEGCDLERRLGVRTGSAGGMIFAPHLTPAPMQVPPSPALQHTPNGPQRTIDQEPEIERPAPAAPDPNSDDPADAILALMGGPKRQQHGR